MQISPLNVQRFIIFLRLFLNKIIVDIRHPHLSTRYAHHWTSRSPHISRKSPFHLIRQVRNFPRQLQLPPYGVNTPLLLPAPHIHVSTCVSPADSHRIASGAPDTLQTTAGSTSIWAGPSTSVSYLLQDHHSTFPHPPTSLASHLRCNILSPSTSALLYASRFSYDRTVPRCHVLISRFTSTHTHTRLMPIAKRISQHITRAQCPPSSTCINKYHRFGSYSIAT